MRHFVFLKMLGGAFRLLCRNIPNMAKESKYCPPCLSIQIYFKSLMPLYLCSIKGACLLKSTLHRKLTCHATTSFVSFYSTVAAKSTCLFSHATTPIFSNSFLVIHSRGLKNVVRQVICSCECCSRNVLVDA